MPDAYVVGTGRNLPERVLTNAELERMVDTNDEWIRSRTGIRERRIVSNGTASSDLGLPAARQALETAGVAAADLDLILVATTTPDHLFPTTACALQASLGAWRAGVLDLLAACSGFVYGIHVGANAIRAGAARRVLVVGADVLSTILNWRDRNTCVLFGDGAGAAVLTDGAGGDGSRRGRVGIGILGGDGGKPDYAILPAGGSRHPAAAETLAGCLHTIQMRGRELFKAVSLKFVELAAETVARAGLKLSDLDLIIPHQMNLRILESAASRLGFPMERMYVNIDRYGNTSSASVPIAIDEALREGRIGAGSRVLLIAFGGGLTWGTALVEW